MATPGPDSPPPAPAGLASVAGTVAACCTVHVLIIVGVIGSLSGFAVGGIAVGAGVAAAAAAWVVATRLWRRRTGAAAACQAEPPGPAQSGPAQSGLAQREPAQREPA